MKQTLNGQIALTKYHSLREFKERLRDGKLMIKAQNELLFLRDTFKFEYYVKRYQLDPEAERRLIRSGRKDLFCIYFRFRRCHRSTKRRWRFSANMPKNRWLSSMIGHMVFDV